MPYHTLHCSLLTPKIFIFSVCLLGTMSGPLLSNSLAGTWHSLLYTHGAATGRGYEDSKTAIYRKRLRCSGRLPPPPALPVLPKKALFKLTSIGSYLLPIEPGGLTKLFCWFGDFSASVKQLLGDRACVEKKTFKSQALRKHEIDLLCLYLHFCLILVQAW